MARSKRRRNKNKGRSKTNRERRSPQTSPSTPSPSRPGDNFNNFNDTPPFVIDDPEGWMMVDDGWGDHPPAPYGEASDDPLEMAEKASEELPVDEDGRLDLRGVADLEELEGELGPIEDNHYVVLILAVPVGRMRIGAYAYEEGRKRAEKIIKKLMEEGRLWDFLEEAMVIEERNFKRMVNNGIWKSITDAMLETAEAYVFNSTDIVYREEEL